MSYIQTITIYRLLFLCQKNSWDGLFSLIGKGQLHTKSEVDGGAAAVAVRTLKASAGLSLLSLYSAANSVVILGVL